MILFGIWGVALFGAWLAGAYDGLQFGWMPLLVGALFCWATLLDRVGFRLFARVLIVSGVLVASCFIGTLTSGGSIDWLAAGAAFAVMIVLAFAVMIFAAIRQARSEGEG